MKKVLFFSLAFFCLSVTIAQDRTKEVSTTIKEVTLYLSGAGINRAASFEIEPGITRVVFSNLSPYLDSRSIQVGLGTEVNILSVSDNAAVLMDAKKLPILKFLADSMEAVQFELELEKNNGFVLEQEQNLLLANMKIAGDKGVVVPELEDALNLYRKELPEIKRKHLLSVIKQRKLQIDLDTLLSRYRIFKQNNERNTREVHITVNASKRTKIDATLQYYVANAGWIPKYDIRSVKVTEPIQLAYKAEMHQNTGENWEGVKMTLSTNNPMYTPALPQLFTNFVELNGWYLQNRGVDNAPQMYGIQEDSKKKGRAFDVNFAQQGQAIINTDISFELPFVVRLNADNQSMVTEVKQINLPVTYKYFSVPKAECVSFLKAQITGWEDVNLLNGEANLYLEGTFLGKTNINPEQIDDTLSLYMGKDRRVVVQRAKVKEKSGKNFFGNKITQSVVWEIEVRNTKKEAVSMEIQDQIPVSKSEDLEVIKDDMGGAEVNDETGLLTWKRTLQPGETLKLRFAFTIKYPKNAKLGSPVQDRLRQLRNDNYF